ncbi:MAG: hypothetical protein QOJ07_2249, partial [Thermoleophilaceae bacterium]|nr:hypothetical protein [Thermoleophilaceae bacterium]
NSFTNPNAQRDFVAMREFHMPRSQHRVPRQTPQLDFHQAISLAGDHGRLMRLLGLAFDLEVPIGAVPVSATTVHARVNVTASFPSPRPGSSTSVYPRTRCLLSTSKFEAEPSGSTLSGRHLKVGDDTQFAVLQVDQDGAALTASGLADNVRLSRSGATTQDTPDSYSLPSLRSGGLAIVHQERSVKFVAALDRSKDINDAIVAAGTPDLFAEDLVRGYTLDVHDSKSGAWHTVCKRTGQYHFPTVGSNQDEPATEEAALESVPSGPADPSDPRKFHLQQSLARWDGWSLAAPRPGLPISRHDDVGTGAPPAPAFPVEFQLKATALPRLRFGTSYALRMRAVDLGCNAAALDPTPTVGDSSKRVTPERPYLRFEPVRSPDVESRTDPVPGESLQTLVIRGNFDVDSPDAATRYILPPRAAQLLCEHHGMFDVQTTPGHTVLNRNAYALIAARESEHYDQNAPIDPGQPVPYLPDPISRGAAIQTFDDLHPGTVYPQMSFGPASGGNWPDNRPFALRVVHGTSRDYVPDNSGRLFLVKLTKADVVRIRLSSTMTQADLDLLGIHGWVKEATNPSAAYLDDARNGQHWMTTPFRELVLIYAVQQPLHAPVLDGVTPQRGTGTTFCAITGNIGIDRKSTGKLEMRARWNEPVDAGPGADVPSGPGAPGTAIKTGDGHAFNMELDDQLLNGHRFAGRHEFGDTKHRRVAYQTIATSKFTEHFVRTAEVTPSPGVWKVLPGGGPIEPRAVALVSQDGRTHYKEGVDFVVDSDAGAIRLPNDLGTVEVTWYPPISRSTPVLPDVVDGPYTADGLPILDVPSSARPAAPEIAYIVPIFKWSDSNKKGVVSSRRSPSALRVYLKRPWWSSGIDELLGVVTWPGAEGNGTGAIPKDIAPFVTDWGRDPIFSSAALPSVHPRLAAFPGSPASARNTALTLDELPGPVVNVAGHAVAFDGARDLWYSDIPINAGKSYTPIIRLALARYQPHSVPGVELSRIAVADFMQVAPGRAVTLAAAKGKLSVTLGGVSYGKAGGVIAGPGYAQAIIEKRDTSIPDKDLGWKPVGKPHPMSDAGKGRDGS